MAATSCDDNPLDGSSAHETWFSFASVPFLTVLIAFITERIIEPRLGPYKPEKAVGEGDKDGIALAYVQDGHLEPASLKARGKRIYDDTGAKNEHTREPHP